MWLTCPLFMCWQTDQPHENAPSCFIYKLWPFPCSFRLRRWRKKQTTKVRSGWDTLTLSASSSVGFGEQTASSALLPSVGHVASRRSCCPHVNLSVPLTQWERGDSAASRSVNHIRPLHTHFLSPSLPLKSTQTASHRELPWEPPAASGQPHCCLRLVGVNGMSVAGGCRVNGLKVIRDLITCSGCTLLGNEVKMWS